MGKKEPTGPMTITLGLEYQIWEAAAKDDDRPVLTTVFFDPAGYAVASNGFVLAVAPVQYENTPTNWQGYTIPAQPLGKAIKTIKRGVAQEIYISYPNAIVATRTGSVTIPLYTRSQFPEWRQLIPDRKKYQKPAAHIAHNVTYMTQVIKAIGLWHQRVAPVLLGDGLMPGLVIGYEGAFGLVMPMFMTPDQTAINKVFSLRPKPPKQTEAQHA